MFVFSVLRYCQLTYFLVWFMFRTDADAVRVGWFVGWWDFGAVHTTSLTRRRPRHLSPSLLAKHRSIFKGDSTYNDSVWLCVEVCDMCCVLHHLCHRGHHFMYCCSEGVKVCLGEKVNRNVTYMFLVLIPEHLFLLLVQTFLCIMYVKMFPCI